MKDRCQIIEPLLAAYALDALEIDEKRQVEAHIDSCPACMDALTDFQSVSDDLMASLPPIEPPARVRANLLAKTAQKNKKEGWVDRWQTIRPKLLPLAAVSSILLLLVFNIMILQSTNQMLQEQETMAQQNQAYQTAFALLIYPESQVAVIEEGELYGTLLYDPDGHVAVLNIWGLDTLSEEQDYQIWLIEPDQTRISGGVFNASEQVEYVSVVIESPTSFEAFTAFGVSIEPQGGSPRPTGPRVFGIDL